MNEGQQPARQSRLLLACGALLGLLLAATGLLESGDGSELADGVMARVNGDTISIAEFNEALGLLQSDKRGRLSTSDRQQVLDRLIEEKLLIARGLDIGLATSDPAVRKAIANSMIQLVIADGGQEPPDDAALQDFYRANLNYFSRPGRLRMRQLLFRGEDAELRAGSVLSGLQAGESYRQLQQDHAEAVVLEVPDVLLPAHKLRDYLGPARLQQLMSMNAGELRLVAVEPAGFAVLWLVEKQPGEQPALAEIAEQVLNEYLRRGDDQAMRSYLEQLKSEADIVRRRGDGV